MSPLFVVLLAVVLLANAGVIPNALQQLIADYRAPRERGGDPTTNSGDTFTIVCSPRTRPSRYSIRTSVR